MFSHVAAHLIHEPAHDKTYNKTCVTSMARVLLHPSLDSPEVTEGTYEQ